MKVKAKLDVQSIKNFALEHGEKVAFAAVGVVFLMFVYSALKREALQADKQPDKLQGKAQQVRSHITQSSFDPKRDGLALVDYVDRAKRDPIDLTGYKALRPLNPQIFDQKAKRDNPTILPLEELRADSGFGVFSLKGDAAADAKAAPAGGGRAAEVGFNPGANSNPVGRGYTVVTGLVPVQKQSQEYSRLFDNAQDANPDRDRPRYLRLVVERAEIDPAQPDKLDWKPLPPSNEFTSRFEGTIGEIISAKFREEGLVDPLGPLVRRSWGDSVNHPRIASAAAAAGEVANPGKPAAERRAGGAAAVRDLIESGRNAGGNRAAAPAPDANVEYRLCRFFDFAVEPKKKYRYRTKAVLHNPNYLVPPQFLVKPDSNAAEFLETEWSNPTGVVVVPDRFGVLAISVGEKWSRDEPSAKLLATAIDEKEGIEAGAEVDVYRASVVNLIAPKVEAVDPRTSAVRQLDNVNFNTGIVVVDIHGGAPLSKKIGASIVGPVEVLVMDGQGNLRVRSELEDQASVGFLAPKKPVPPSKAKEKEADDVPKGPAKRPPVAPPTGPQRKNR
ncbi:MAG: hypothetical protein WD845_13580 [Pirellulales bacterium]